MVGSKSRDVWGHTGQHSPGGTWGFSHSSRSWHWISSQRIAPLSQTQIWHGEGFQISLFRYICPFWVQAISSPSSPGTEERIYKTFSNHEIKGMGLDKERAQDEKQHHVRRENNAPALLKLMFLIFKYQSSYMSFLIYHLISWSERRKIESPWSAQFLHSTKWTWLMSFWLSACSEGCHLCPEELLPTLCSVQVLSTGHWRDLTGDKNLWHFCPERHTLPAPCWLIQPDGTDTAAVGGKKKESHLLGKIYLLV